LPTFTHLGHWHQGLLLNGLPFEPKNGIAKVKPPTLRGVYPRFDTSSLAIFTFCLKAVQQDGNPAEQVLNYLKPYFQHDPGALKYVSVSFDIDPGDASAVQRHVKVIDNHVKKLLKYVINFVFNDFIDYHQLGQVY
jgi:hypothetical protein